MRLSRSRLESSNNCTDDLDSYFCDFADAYISIFVISYWAAAPLHPLQHVPLWTESKFSFQNFMWMCFQSILCHWIIKSELKNYKNHSYSYFNAVSQLNRIVIIFKVWGVVPINHRLVGSKFLNVIWSILAVIIVFVHNVDNWYSFLFWSELLCIFKFSCFQRNEIWIGQSSPNQLNW